jgi:hypothetical protein
LTVRLKRSFSGNSVEPANLAAGIASMRQRIAQLDAEKIKPGRRPASSPPRPGRGPRWRFGSSGVPWETNLLDRMEDLDEPLKNYRAAVNRDLDTALPLRIANG